MRLAIHHIGGRAGSRAFPVYKAFEKDIVNVLYEADSECIQHIKERSALLSSELHVLPYCLGASCNDEGIINITYDPYTSSLYELNPEYKSYYSLQQDCDYHLSDAFKIVERRRVSIITLDDLWAAKDRNFPMPDFLSIDTEGSAYDILSGASRTLQTSVIGLVVEADLHPVFKGQRIYGDIVRLLTDAGFDFIRFLGIHKMFQFRVPIGLLGEGVDGTSDALFLRNPEAICRLEDNREKRSMLQKAAFVAIAFNHFDYAVECMRLCDTLPASTETGGGKEPAYISFMNEFEREVKKVSIVYQKTFVEKYPTFSASNARFEHSDVQKPLEFNIASVLFLIKQRIRKRKLLYSFLQHLMHFIRTGKYNLKVLIKRICAGHTSIELLMLKYGLKEQAGILKKKRIYQST